MLVLKDKCMVLDMCILTCTGNSDMIVMIVMIVMCKKKHLGLI